MEQIRIRYRIHKSGKSDGYSIDFEAMAAHLMELHKVSKKQGIDVRRVIFAPDLQPHLFRTKHGRYLKLNLRFSKKRSWVRHDEHYHVDFRVGCKKL